MRYIFFIFFCLVSFSALSQETKNPLLVDALREIELQYGDRVSISGKGKTLIKYGRNDAVGTSETTVMTLPSGELHETYVTTNIIDKFSSSDDGDDQQWKVEGHICVDGVPTDFVPQEITLQGQDETALTTPLCRVTRAYSNDSTSSAGAIYFYEDDTVSSGVPQTAEKIHLTVPAGLQQSAKASTALSEDDYAICTQVTGSLLEKTSSYADFRLQIR